MPPESTFHFVSIHSSTTSLPLFFSPSFHVVYSHLKPIILCFSGHPLFTSNKYASRSAFTLTCSPFFLAFRLFSPHFLKIKIIFLLVFTLHSFLPHNVLNSLYLTLLKPNISVEFQQFTFLLYPDFYLLSPAVPPAYTNVDPFNQPSQGYNTNTVHATPFPRCNRMIYCTSYH